MRYIPIFHLIYMILNGVLDAKLNILGDYLPVQKK